MKRGEKALPHPSYWLEMRTLSLLCCCCYGNAYTNLLSWKEAFL